MEIANPLFDLCRTINIPILEISAEIQRSRSTKRDYVFSAQN